MRCKWNKEELEKLKKLAIQQKDIFAEETINEMINILNINYNDLFLDNSHNAKKETITEIIENYTLDLETIPENILEAIKNFFLIDEDSNITLEDPPRRILNINNKELFEMGYECLAELRSKKLLKLYTQLIDPRNHYINLVSYNNPSCLYGITYYESLKSKNYITIFREFTAIDFLTLIHEVLHAYCNNFIPKIRYGSWCFSELEGQLGNYLATNFLDKQGFTKHAKETYKIGLDRGIFNSFKYYVCDTLLNTAGMNGIDIKSAKKQFSNETDIKLMINKNLAFEFLSEYAYEYITETLCYLIISDLSVYSRDKKEMLEITMDLKKYEEHALSNLYDYGITFMDDNYANIRELKKVLDK